MSNLLIDEPPLQVLPSLAMAVGLNEGIILQQIHYWLRHKQADKDKYAGSFIGGHWWVWNSVPEWQRQFPFWGDNTIRRALNTLREIGVLVTEHLSADPYDKTTYYRIDYDVLNTLTHAVVKQKGSNRKREEGRLRADGHDRNGQTDVPTMGRSSSPMRVNQSRQVGQMDMTGMGASTTETTAETSSENTQRELLNPERSVSTALIAEGKERIAASPPAVLRVLFEALSDADKQQWRERSEREQRLAIKWPADQPMSQRVIDARAKTLFEAFIDKAALDAAERGGK